MRLYVWFCMDLKTWYNVLMCLIGAGWNILLSLFRTDGGETKHNFS